ncbi:MAG TPA: TIM barrel protein, partial [Bryobacteraceae bacterium]
MKNENSRFSRRDFARTAALGAGALSAMGLTGAEKTAANIKLGLYSITYLGVWYGGDALTLEQVVQRAKQFGYHGVEIDGKRPHGNPLDMPKKRCKDLQKFAKDQGIELYAVAADNDFSSPIPEFREAQVVYVRELIRMTADLDVKILRVFLGWPGVTLKPEGGARYDIAQQVWKETHKEFSPERTWDWCRDGLKESVKYAADAGVTLALQNHAPVIRNYRDVL